MKMYQQVTMLLLGLSVVAVIAGCCCCGGGAPPANGVRVITVTTNMSDEEVQELHDKLAALAGNDATMSSNIMGAQQWDFITDDEPQAFADKIDFATVTGVQDRMITIDATSTGTTDEVDDTVPADGNDLENDLDNDLENDLDNDAGDAITDDSGDDLLVPDSIGEPADDN